MQEKPVEQSAAFGSGTGCAAPGSEHRFFLGNPSDTPCSVTDCSARCQLVCLA